MASYLIAYDVSSARARDKVAARLEKAGQRLQFSLYLLECSEEACEKLLTELKNCLKGEASLLCLPICRHCYANAKIMAPEIPLMEFF